MSAPCAVGVCSALPEVIGVQCMRVEPEVLVLLSGGIDSAATVAFYLEYGRPPAALHVDYAQPARREEAEAAAAVASHFGISLSVGAWNGPVAKGIGLIQGRNLFLVAIALMERPPSVSVLALGLHAGTAYADSSAQFLRAAERVVGAASGPDVTVAAPFLEWPKREVYAYARRAGVPFSLTYSCEAAGGPCGRCLSCSDLEMLDARA